MTGRYASAQTHQPQSETIQLQQQTVGMAEQAVIVASGPRWQEGGTGREGTFWEQYKALVKRNIAIKKRERQKTITEFALPLYFLLILVILRLTIPAPTYPAIMDPHDNGFLPFSIHRMNNATIHVAPNTTQVISVMSAVGAVLAGDVVYYQTEEELVEFYRLDPVEVQVAVVFPYNPLTNLSYTIRMNPATLSLPDATARMASETSCRNTGVLVGGLESSSYCPPNKYYATGFLGLQRLLDDALLQVSGLGPWATRRADNQSYVALQSFPKDAVVSTNLDVLRSIVPLYMVFTWAQFILYMLVLIVEEKEKKIKEGMKMMGLQGVVYWLSWLTIYGMYVIVLATICIIVLPLSGVFQHANVGIVFVLFVLYGFSAIVLALMMTPFFSKAKVAGVVGNLTQVFMSLLFYLQVYLGDKIAPGWYWLMALMSPCAFSMAIDKILLFDVTDNGLSMSNLWEGPGLPFAGSLIMISVDILLYLALALYLDAVVPTEYGTKEKPWFFLQPSFWRKRNTKVQMRSYSNPSVAGLDDDEGGGLGYGPLRTSSRAGSERSTSSGTLFSEDIEPVSPDMVGREAVIIKSFSKTFPGPRGKPPVQAVKDFSLTIYEGQITAILGHNGAGKTTLFNMLTGMTEPTGGRASIFGLDVSDSRDLREIRSMTGVCPQHDILFAVLTPREHLSFYARIRGVPEHEIKSVVDQTLSEVDLVKKADSKADNLSGGQKRKLSIGIALIGDPRMIFLDEPTAGVDAYSRRRLWGLLQGRKKGKVILLTTHFMDEADVLADRKAVMTKGHVRCCGSSLFLKNKFGLGYYLTLIVNHTTDPAAVLSLLRRVVPQATMARHFGKEMAFVLPHDSTGQFSPLFRLLDEYKSMTVDDISIEDYGISMTTLEEVFLTLNTKAEEDDEGSLKSIKNITEELIKSKRRSASPLQNGNTPDRCSSPTSSGAGPETSTVQGGAGQGFAIEDVQVEYSWWRAFRALLWLRTLSIIREPLAIAFMIVFPLGFTVGSIALLDSQTINMPSESIITFTTALLGNRQLSALIHNGTDEPLSGFEEAFDLNDLTMDDYDGSYSAIFPARPHIAAFDVHDLPQTSASLLGQSVSLAYNTSYLHVLPVLVNLLSNAAILQGASPPNASIRASSSLLPTLLSTIDFDASSFFAPIMIGMVYTLIPAGLAIEMVTDREIKARNLLRLNGVSFNLYFSSFFINLSIIYFIVYVGLLVIIVAFDVASFTIAPAFTTLAVLYLLYLPSAMVYSAVLSYLFDKTETARQFYPNMATTVGFLTYNVVSLVDLLAEKDATDPALVAHCIFTVTTPFYIPFGLLYYINKVYLMCSIAGSCDQLDLSDYMTVEISLMFFMCIFNSFFYYLLLRVVDAKKTGGSIKEALFMKVDEEMDRSLWQQEVVEGSKEDEDVKAERLLVQEKAKSLQTAAKPPPALIFNLGKVFKGEEGSTRSAKKNPCKKGSEEEGSLDFIAVESVSLALQPGEVLGLLGPNGAGKTTTLKIVTAEETADRGAVWVGGGRVSSVLSPSLSSLGYCPQHDCVWRRITVKEHLQLYCDVRGVKEGQLDQLLDAYLDGLQIREHADKQSHACSGGTKRKLSYIISMMGRPSVVLLDEPSTGMDPKSKRFLWDSILASFRGQRSAVLTTHAMEEADALCSRIGIMVKGALRCVGSVQSLKNKYGGGYNLELKLRQPNTTEVADAQEAAKSNLREVQSLIESTFQDASYDEPPFAERLVYKIPQSSVQSLADCFSTLEQLKASRRVVEYAFSQTTLEQVFLLFAKEQDMEDEEEEQLQEVLTRDEA